MKVLLCFNDHGQIIPAFDRDRELLRHIKRGEPFAAEITVPRNLLLHKKYWTLINLVFDNQEAYKNIDVLRQDITIDAGFYTEYIDVAGEVRKKAVSISFDSMEEHVFVELYSKTVDSIVQNFHFNKQALIKEVEAFF